MTPRDATMRTGRARANRGDITRTLPGKDIMKGARDRIIMRTAKARVTMRMDRVRDTMKAVRAIMETRALRATMEMAPRAISRSLPEKRKRRKREERYSLQCLFWYF